MKESKQQLLSSDESNPLYNKIIDNTILLSYETIIKKNGRESEILFLSRVERIATSPNTMLAYKHFLAVGCSFTKDLFKIPKIPASTTYNTIGKLLEAGLIHPITKLKMYKSPGTRPTLYGVEGVTEEEIQNAVARYKRYRTRSYAFVEAIYQRTLDEVRDEQIQYTKIVNLARAHGVGGFAFLDVANQVATLHSEAGVKVWRTG